MLVLPTDRQWKTGPPAAIKRFRDTLAEDLGDAWNVALQAYDNDAPDDAEDISAEAVATHGDLVVSITRHAGFDTVLVGVGDVPPAIPFEDLAAACGWADKDQVLALADQNPDDVKPLVRLEKTLWMLRESQDELPDKLKDDRFMRKVHSIADEFAERLFTNSHRTG